MDKAQLSAAYRLIAELFVYPDDRDAEQISAEMARLKTTPEALVAPLKAFLAEPAASSAEEFVATLELSPPAPLYLGAYLYQEPTSCRGAGMSGRNGYMLELASIYRHFGVELSGRELADFLPVVIEFLAISLERESHDAIGLRRYFVEGSLINAIEALLGKLRKLESPYTYLIESLRVALREDIARMAGGPKWRPASADAQPSAVAAERSLTPAGMDESEMGVKP